MPVIRNSDHQANHDIRTVNSHRHQDDISENSTPFFDRDDRDESMSNLKMVEGDRSQYGAKTNVALHGGSSRGVSPIDSRGRQSPM
jgi:hypothetical protein